MSDTYYHFVRINESGQPYLGHGDNRTVKVGETVKVEGQPVPCEHGLHASMRAIDALDYAPEGRVAMCEVTLGGIVKHDNDKGVAQERTIIRMLDVDQTAIVLRAFARWCALSVAHLWDMPDVIRQYLETGDESIREIAWAASWAASASVADAAVWAAEAASAADAAATSAVWAAAASAADAVSRAAQNTKLIAMFEEAFNE